MVLNRGLCDNRSEPAEPAAFFSTGPTGAASLIKVNAPRKLRVGDVISVVTDLILGAVTIVVNDNEFSHTFGNERLMSQKIRIPSVTNSRYNGRNMAALFGEGPKGEATEFVAGATLGTRVFVPCNQLTL